MGTTPVNPANLWSAVTSCGSDHWRSAGKWLAYTVGCGFLPIMIGLLLVWIFSTKPVNWYDFVVHGEFLIYSAALIAASTRLISRDTATFPFVHREMFTLAAFLALASCVALYSAIKTAILFRLQDTINNPRIVRFSMIILVVSLAFSFLVFLLDQQRVNPNVIGILAHQENQLSAAFDNLGNPQ
jgi:hypothetical protein